MKLLFVIIKDKPNLNFIFQFVFKKVKKRSWMMISCVNKVVLFTGSPGSRHKRSAFNAVYATL